MLQAFKRDFSRFARAAVAALKADVAEGNTFPASGIRRSARAPRTEGWRGITLRVPLLRSPNVDSAIKGMIGAWLTKCMDAGISRATGVGRHLANVGECNRIRSRRSLGCRPPARLRTEAA